MMSKKGDNLSAYERNRLFLNHDGKAFVDASFTSSVDIDSDSRSAIGADFNNDGYPDLLVGSVGGGPVRLFSNRFPKEMNFVLLDLVGKESNRLAIGCRIVAECSHRRIVRDFFPANGFMGQGPSQLHVGVGTAKKIDRLTIRWPSGRSQELANLPVCGRVTITEGDEDYQFSEMSKPSE